MKLRIALHKKTKEPHIGLVDQFNAHIAMVPPQDCFTGQNQVHKDWAERAACRIVPLISQTPLSPAWDIAHEVDATPYGIAMLQRVLALHKDKDLDPIRMKAQNGITNIEAIYFLQEYLTVTLRAPLLSLPSPSAD